MKFTREIVSNIKKSCRRVCGGRRSISVGQWGWRGVDHRDNAFNLLLKGAEKSSLYETVPIDLLINKLIADADGWVGLDCFCYNLPLFGREPYDVLDKNVYILIGPCGSVKYASDDDLGYRVAMEKLRTA